MWHINRIYKALEHNWLKKNIYYGLRNLNDGFDAETIYYFAEEDFIIVLQRCIEKEVGIHGIEPWYKGRFYGVEGCDAYDRLTQVLIFKTFQNLNLDLQYAASYHVPTKFLNLDYFFGFGKLQDDFERVLE
jgi:hypothetical protein